MVFGQTTLIVPRFGLHVKLLTVYICGYTLISKRNNEYRRRKLSTDFAHLNASIDSIRKEFGYHRSAR